MNRQDIKLMVDRLTGIDCDAVDTPTINAAITMLKDLGGIVDSLRAQLNGQTCYIPPEFSAQLSASQARVAELEELLADDVLRPRIAELEARVAQDPVGRKARFCQGCRHAEWKRTKTGKLHPSGDGRCKYPWKLPQLPASMFWTGMSEPSPNGGQISRNNELKAPCVYFKKGDSEREGNRPCAWKG